MKTWIPTTTTGLVSEIQRLAKEYLWKKYTKADLQEKYDYGVNYYKNQCKSIWRKPDIWICKQRWNKVLYAILESVKNEIRQSKKWLEQTKLF